MDEKTLKTSLRQRIIIIIIAVLLLVSTVLTYMFIVLNNGSSSNNSTNNTEALIAEYNAKNDELNAAAQPLSDKYFSTLESYRSRVKAYNEAAATSAILETTDLKEGTGRTLEEGDQEYFAYYIGWCADGSIFDSSFDTGTDSETDPTSLSAPLDASMGLIEGWNQGVVGMKLGGVREITMTGDLAYGSNREICGGYNKPLKFIVLPIERDENLVKLNEELTEIYYKLYMASVQ